MKTQTGNKHSFWKLVVSILICEFTGIASSFLSQPGSSVWLESLQKPSWFPPYYLFGAVWGVLYLLMGISLWLVWKSNASSFQKGTAVLVFLIQLFLNFFWSILFFRYQSPVLALTDILLMVIAILVTIFQFSAISKTAAWLLVPYMLWVCFAAFLNYTIWIMN
jgi:translocator protein